MKKKLKINLKNECCLKKIYIFVKKIIFMSVVDRKVWEKEVLKVLILKGVKKFFLEKGIE